MALPTYTDLRNYLRLSTTAEDTLLASLVTEAQAIVEGLIGTPLTAAERVFRVRPACDPILGVGTVLYLPDWPIADDDTLLIEDPDGLEFMDEVTVDERSGTITATDTTAPYVAAWYTVTVNLGWDAHPEYETKYEPAINAAILDVAADLFQRRSPGATSESEADASRGYDATIAVLGRVRGSLNALMKRRVR